MKSTIDDATNAEWREADKSNQAAIVEVVPEQPPMQGVAAVATGSADGFLRLLAGVVEAERLVVAGLKPEMPCRKMHENRHRAFREALSMATAYFQPNTEAR